MAGGSPKTTRTVPVGYSMALKLISPSKNISQD